MQLYSEFGRYKTSAMFVVLKDYITFFGVDDFYMRYEQIIDKLTVPMALVSPGYLSSPLHKQIGLAIEEILDDMSSASAWRWAFSWLTSETENNTKTAEAQGHLQMVQAFETKATFMAYVNALINSYETRDAVGKTYVGSDEDTHGPGVEKAKKTFEEMKIYSALYGNIATGDIRAFRTQLGMLRKVETRAHDEIYEALKEISEGFAKQNDPKAKFTQADAAKLVDAFN